MASTIPLFPLGTVLVPGLVLPLHVFEARYRRLVADLLALPADEREFGVVAIREGWEVGPAGARALYGTGTSARLRQVAALPDGRYDVVTTGARRFRLLDLDEDLPYLRGRVEWIPERPGDAAGPLAASVRRRYAQYRAAVAAAGGGPEAGRMPDLPDDPTVLSYAVAAAVVADLSDRQGLLEARDTSGRLRAELALLRRETALLQALPSLPAVELARAPMPLS